MLIVKKDDSVKPIKISLSGVIDETCNFATAFGNITESADFYCHDLTRINSVGIKLWREYFSKLRTAKVALRFFELPPAIVATVNYISDFVSSSEIISILAPFHCPSCNHTSLKLLDQTQLKTIRSAIPNAECEKCKAPAEFDEIPEEYFSFLG